MKKHPVFILLLAIALLPAQQLCAWGQKGHRIIARIAYDNLTGRARRSVDNILGKEGIIFYANWPDEIKSDTIYPDSYDWHFQDLDAGLSDSALIATLTDYPAVGGNLWRATDSLTALLLREPRNNHALRFIVHLVGDRFCPMHTAHIEDLGGNRVPFRWFTTQTNLHAVWDTHLIESQGYSYTEYAAYLQLRYASHKADILRRSRADELRYNYALTEAIYAYQTPWDGNTYHYIYRVREPMEWQLYCAGITLAGLLNTIYR